MMQNQWVSTPFKINKFDKYNIKREKYKKYDKLAYTKIIIKTAVISSQHQQSFSLHNFSKKSVF